MAATVPQAMELTASPQWRTVDFISDLHLHASEPETFAVWQHYMQSTPADALFILGDLFEAWVGDDAVAPDLQTNGPSFEGRCAQVLGQTANRLSIFFMHGNRDFLVGQDLMDLCHMTLLEDPCLLEFPPVSGQRWLLSHGDALCILDTDYMQFREQVRADEWKKTFLAKPLAERQTIARELRRQSEAKKQTGADYADVDAVLAAQWLQAANAKTMIHGHTHKPALHGLGGGTTRVVLSDWDVAATPPRAEVLRLDAGGLRRISLA